MKHPRNNSARKGLLPHLVASHLAMLAALILGCSANAAEYRAFWVDAWGAGFLNQSQVNSLLGVVGTSTGGTIRDANCNMVIVQVRRRFDVCYPSGVGEPYMTGLSPANFNALAAMIKAAHDTTGGKKRVEVHCWSVAFKTDNGTVYSQHNDTPTGSLTEFDNYWPTRISSATGAENASGALDPGHPKCLEYLVNAHMDLVNFQTTAGPDGTDGDIDGIHYDYIRFEANTEGYNPTSVARYNARYGLTGDPASSSEQFKQWRRDQVTAFVRQMYARIQKTKPWVRQSGSFVTWNPSPTSSTRAGFQATRPYYDVYSDWDSWMQEGTVDMAVPMTYYNWASLPNDYTRWMNFEKDRKFNRHMIIGPGTYLNSLADAILELQKTRDASPAGNYAHGFSGYSYRVPYSGGTWSGFSPSLVSDVTPTWADIPDMPWKSAPTKGHMMGAVTIAGTGAWADFATVSIAGPTNRSMSVDGTGFYAFIDLPPGSYTVTASKSGYPNVTGAVNVAIGQVTGNMYEQYFVLGGSIPPVISNVQASNITDSGATITWTTDVAGSSRVEYGQTMSYGSATPLDPTAVTSHSVGLSGLAANTLYHYRVVSGNAYGTSYSGDYTFTTTGPPSVSNVQASNITDTSATITWATDAPANSQVRYGLTSSYGQQTTVDPALVKNHSVNLTGLTPSTTYHYQAVSVNPYGTAQSSDMTFTTGALITDIIIDNSDPGWSNTSPSGSWTSGATAGVPKIGTNYLYYAGTASSSITRSCRWTPQLGTAGFYDVYVYYQIGANRTAGATYRVTYNGGTVSSLQNQYSTTPNQGGWFLVGTNLPFAAGTAGYVELGNDAVDTALVSADAAKFVRVAAPAPPSITLQPQPSTQSVNVGQSATFTVTATGTPPPNYQWRFNSLPIPGATASTYTRNNAQPADAGSYSVVVTNTAGSVTSSNAILTVNVPPTITSQPVPQTVVAGQNAIFSVTATGTAPLSYQWRLNNVDIGGATASDYTRNNVQPADAGSYSVVVTNVAGSGTSLDAVLTVNVAPAITTQPAGVTVNQGSNATFAVLATGTAPLAYQWYFGGLPVASATDSYFIVTNSQPAAAGNYSVEVLNAAGQVTSSNATLAVNVPPVITAQPQSVTAAVGSNVTFTVTATGTAPLAYQWRCNGTNVAYGTASAYTCNSVQTADAGSYSVVVSNVAGTLASDDAVLTVTQPTPPQIDNISLVPGGQVQLQVSGSPGHYAVDAAANLSDWAELTNFTATVMPFQYVDSETNLTQRFYRVRLLP